MPWSVVDILSDTSLKKTDFLSPRSCPLQIVSSRGEVLCSLHLHSSQTLSSLSVYNSQTHICTCSALSEKHCFPGFIHHIWLFLLTLSHRSPSFRREAWQINK